MVKHQPKSARCRCPEIGGWKVIDKRIYIDAISMCRHQLLNPEALKSYKGITGYANVANDLLLVSSVLLCNWSSIEGRYPIQLSDLTHAEQIAMRMQRLIGLRKQAPSFVATHVDNRSRAFTLLMRAYDSVRKAVTYLRWESGDADIIAPTLYEKRSRRLAAEDAATTPASIGEQAPSASQPEAASPQAAQPSIASAPTPTAHAPQALSQASTPRTLSVPVPGSNPFMD
jgi:hypothetical protein